MIAKSRKIKREGRQSIIFSIFLGALTIAVIGFLLVSNFKINQRRAGLIAQLESLKKEVKALEAKKAELQVKVSESTSETYLEKEARERLGLKKPGEEVVVVLPPEEKAQEKVENKGFWQTLFQKLKFW